MKTFQDRRPLYGQDPHITPYNGAYLLIQSEDEERITLTKLSSLVNFSQYTPYESHVVWDHPDERQVWAPELHFYSGRWQIFYSFSDGNNRTHRTHTLTSLSDNPFGPYQRDRVGPDVWGIDQTTFQYNGLHYSVQSGWEPNQQEEFPQNLYISLRGSNNASCLIRISEPTLDWEGEINEGPQWMDEPDVGTGLLFSANQSWTQDYCTGFLELHGTNPLDLSHWAKDPKPHALNMGHAQVLEDQFIYHTKLSQFPGWNDRVISSCPLLDII